MLDLCRPAAELLQLQQTLMEQCFPASTVLLPSGAQVAVRQCGQRSGKPSIVLLHGISSGAASWLHPALLLAEQRRERTTLRLLLCGTAALLILVVGGLLL